MKSSGPVFTRQNPFPPVSTVKRAHYHPSRKQSLSKKDKKITLSPVRLHQRSNHPPRSRNQESQQLCENQDFSASDGQHVFTEIWPSNECGSSPDSNTDFPEMLPDKPPTRSETSAVPSGVKEDSVLAKSGSVRLDGESGHCLAGRRTFTPVSKSSVASNRLNSNQLPYSYCFFSPSLSSYVNGHELIVLQLCRTPVQSVFRRGRPQSREERQQMVSTDGEEQMPFWWMTHSSVPSSTPTKDGHDSAVCSPDEQPKHDRSFSWESDDTEIINLQERASRLLLKGECSPSDGSIPVSSDGLACSDFSSPVSVDEPMRQPLIPSLMKATAAKISPDSAPAASSQKSVLPTMTPPTHPEEDILFQWRLRRKMEQARGWSQSMKQSGLHDSACSWQAPSLIHASAIGQPYKQQQSFWPPHLSERDAHPHMTAPQPEITEAHKRGAPAPSPPHFLTAALPSSSLMSQPQALSHVPAHMHLLCDVLPCPNQSSLANDDQSTSQKLSEPQPKVVHKKTQVSESLLSTNKDGPVKERLPSSLHASSGSIKEEGPSQQKVHGKNKKKKLVTKESDQKTALPSRQQRKPARESSKPSVPKNATLKEQYQHDESEEVHKASCTGGHLPPSSPVHTALGQVISEVLFPTVAQKTPVSSFSTPKNISSSSQSPVSLNVTQNSLEVISQLLQEAEDSDGKEFEDDPLLQVLRHQRKWVKDQIRAVDVMLNESLEEQPVA
ncbi:proline and serine-rich protein 3 [Anableps anableps]